MQNRYMRGAHLKERKFKAILRAFCEDIEASKIASLNSVGRKTVNILFSKFRQRIMLLAEQERLQDVTSAEVDESWFGHGDKNLRWGGTQTIVFGLLAGGKVYTQIISKVNKSEIYPVITRCCREGAIILSDAAPVYLGLAGLGFKHFFVNHSAFEFCRTEGGLKVGTNGIESYWSWAKLRLSKFKGIRWEKYTLHLKECEWRFNHRLDDIYLLLLKEFRLIPI